jgi:hypothetical protein
MFKHLLPAALIVLALEAAPAVAGTFFGPCLYGAPYYREFPQRTYLRHCCCRPPQAAAPVAPAPQAATPVLPPPLPTLPAPVR